MFSIAEIVSGFNASFHGERNAFKEKGTMDFSKRKKKKIRRIIRGIYDGQ